MNASHTNWDQLIYEAAFTIDTSQQETTKETPFQLVYLKTDVLPGESDFGCPWHWRSDENRTNYASNVRREWMRALLASLHNHDLCDQAGPTMTWQHRFTDSRIVTLPCRGKSPSVNRYAVRCESKANQRSHYHVSEDHTRSYNFWILSPTSLKSYRNFTMAESAELFPHIKRNWNCPSSFQVTKRKCYTALASSKYRRNSLPLIMRHFLSDVKHVPVNIVHQFCTSVERLGIYRCQYGFSRQIRDTANLIMRSKGYFLTTQIYHWHQGILSTAG